MTSKKLGALLRSVPPATVTEAGDPPVPQPGPETQSHTPRQVLPLSAEPPAPSSRPSTPVHPEVPLQVLIPLNIRKQLAIKAAEEGQSLRALVLQAIRSLGIAVTDADIKGKRGQRGA